MYKLILFLGICSAFALGSKLTKPPKDSEKMVACYNPIGEPYNNGPVRELEKKGLDASLCSHIFYTDLVGIDKNGSISISGPYSDPDLFRYKHFNGFWKKNPRIKTLAQIDVCDDCDSADVPMDLLINPHLRGKVVNTVVTIVKKFELNGIGLDLRNIESLNGVPNTKKKNLVLLLKALKEEFDKEGFILSVTVLPLLDTSYDMKGISTYVNFVNLMAFYLHKPSDFSPKEKKLVGHTSPLYPSLKENAEARKKNIDYVVKYWIKNGAPANKLILGITLNGVSYTLTNPKQIGRGAPFSGDGKDIFPEYTQVCARSTKPEWKYFYDKEQQVPYFYQGNQIVAVDNVESTKAKAEYINRMKLGGAALQYFDQDDIAGKCGEKFSILKTLNRVLRNKC